MHFLISLFIKLRQTHIFKYQMMKKLCIIVGIVATAIIVLVAFADQQTDPEEPPEEGLWMLLLGYALIALSAALVAIAAIIITFILVYVSPLSEQRKTMFLKALTPIVKMVPSSCLPENLKKIYDSPLQLKQSLLSAKSSQIIQQKVPHIQHEPENTKPRQKEKKVIVLGRRGLVNLGNTCYFNSALQCLHKTYQINQACIQSTIGNEGIYKNSFIHLFEELSKEESRPFNPSEVKRLVSNYNPLFQGKKQHDSCEVLGTMIRMLHDDTNEVKEKVYLQIDEQLRKDDSKCHKLWKESKKREQLKEKSVMDDVIYGRYKTVYECQVCYQKYILFQKFHAVYLPLPVTKGKITLQDCFSQFSIPDLMTGSNMMECNRCQKDQETKKNMTVYETNEVLIICLKRFNEKEKRDEDVKIPFKLDKKFMKKAGNYQDCEYQLYGLILHHGSMQWGHYYAICYQQKYGWVLYNDSQYRSIEEKEVQREALQAYVLFYRRLI